MASIIGVLWNERDTAQAADFKRSYRVAYLVMSKAGQGAQQEALTAPGLPGLFSPYAAPAAGKSLVRTLESDPSILAKTISAKQWESHPDLWEVTVEYASDCPDPYYQANDPTQRPARFRYSTERYREGMEQDANGFPLANTAGTPYDPVEADRSLLVVEIEKNLPEYDPGTLGLYIDSVNDDPFLAWEPYQIKVHNIEAADRAFENAVIFWPTKLILHIKEPKEVNLATGIISSKPWRMYLLDIGEEWFDPVPQVYRRFIDGNGRPLGKPQLLNGIGQPLPRGAPAVFNEFVVFTEESFIPLADLFLS